MDVERVLILDYGNLCHYDTLRDLVVISKCYYDDPELFDFLLEHELEHRRIHKLHGYGGILEQVGFDWVSRFHFMGRDYETYKKIMVARKGKDDSLRLKDVCATLLYALLTLPTGFFQLFADARRFLEWLDDWLARVLP